MVAIPRLGCNEDSIFFVGGFEPERPDPWSAAAFFSSLGQVIADVHGMDRAALQLTIFAAAISRSALLASLSS